MALQFHYNRGKKRDTLIAFEEGFHGDTFGAMSASGLSSYNGPFEDFLLKVERIPRPQEDTIDEVLAMLENIIKNNSCAAFVFEPLVQGAAGMKFHSAKGLDALIEKCQKAGVLCIADEVMTGFGKTGKNFASDYLQYKPDIICLSKALTAGMFPLSITSCSLEVYNAFLSEEVSKGFFHAHTFSAHPLGCAAALAGIELLNSPEILERRSAIEKGVILAVDLKVKSDRYGSLRNELYDYFMNQGVVLRPLGNTIYTLPPYVVTDEELQKIYNSIEGALKLF